MTLRTCRSEIGRREANKEARRDSIIDVATKRFLNHGYAGTTMSAIASRLGGSKGTLWSYFPSKEKLFAAVIDTSSMAFRSQIAEILDPTEDVEETMRRYAGKYLARITSPQAIALQRLIIGECSRFPEVGRIFYEHGSSVTLALLSDYIEKAMAMGFLRTADPHGAARDFTGLCMSGCHQMLITGAIPEASDPWIANDVERVVATFMRAYAT